MPYSPGSTRKRLFSGSKYNVGKPGYVPQANPYLRQKAQEYGQWHGSAARAARNQRPFKLVGKM